MIDWSALLINQLNLSLVFVPLEEHLLQNEFSEDAAHWPHVHRFWVISGSQEQLGRTIPQGHHSIRVVHVVVTWEVDTRQSEIC